MKKILLLVVAYLAVCGVGHGALINGVRVSGTIVPLDDQDEYAVIDSKWGKVDFRVVTNATERTTLTSPAGVTELRRRLGMIALQLDDNHVYQLTAMPNTWADLGVFNLSGSNMYTTNGTLSGNRTITGGNYDLSITGVDSFLVNAGNSNFDTTNDLNISSLNGPVTIDSGGGSLFLSSLSGFVDITAPEIQFNTNTVPWLFKQSPAAVIPAQDTLVVRNPTTGELKVTTATLASSSNNLYTVNGTLTGSRVVSGSDAYSITFGDVPNFIVSGGSTFVVDSTNGVYLGSAASSATLRGATGVLIQTPLVASLSADQGMVLMLDDVSGVAEWGSVYFQGQGTQSGTNYSIGNANLFPDYDSVSEIPEGTIGYFRFDANSVGGDSIKMGPNTTQIKIARQDGTDPVAGEIKANYYYTFVKSGTGASARWVIQGAPSSMLVAESSSKGLTVVTNVAQLIAIDPTMCTNVMTRGYYTQGDGGAGTYYWVNNQTTTNYGSKIASSVSGSWELVPDKVLSSMTFGITNSASLNQYARLTNYFKYGSGKRLFVEPGSYRSVGGLTVHPNTIVEAHSTIWDVETSGNNDRAFHLEYGVHWKGGTVTCEALAGGDSGEDHVAFRIGYYNVPDGPTTYNVTLEDVTTDIISAGGTIYNNIVVMGDVYNVLLRNIVTKVSAVNDCGIMVHWGADFGAGAPSVSNPTYHPHNVTIDGAQIGAMTKATGVVAGISFAGAYASTAQNVTVDNALIGISWDAGDYGFEFSDLVNSNQIAAVSYKNCVVHKARGYGMWANGSEGYGTKVSRNYPVFENCTATGQWTTGDLAGTDKAGFRLTHLRGAVFRDCIVKGFQYGTTFATNVQNVSFLGGSYSDNRVNGAYFGSASVTNILFRGVSFERNGWGTSGATACGIYAQQGSHITIDGCKFGDSVSVDSAQETACYLRPPAANIVLVNNHVFSVKAAGVGYGYQIGHSGDAGHLKLVMNNGTDPYIGTNYSAVANIPIAIRNGTRIFTGTVVPTTGTYVVGDVVLLESPGTLGATLTCTVAGSPGTWVRSAASDSFVAGVDADATYTPGTSGNDYILSVALTGNRTLTLSTTGAYAGLKVKYARTSTSTGASTMTIAGKALATSQWAEATYDGSAWVLTKYGSL